MQQYAMAAALPMALASTMVSPNAQAQCRKPDKAVEIVIGTTPGGQPGTSAAQIAYWDTTLARVMKSWKWLKDLKRPDGKCLQE